MLPDQTVAQMAEEVLARQAKAMLTHTGESFESALEAVSSTHAGQRLRDLANGEHRHEKASEWQGSVFAEDAEGAPEGPRQGIGEYPPLALCSRPPLLVG